MDHEIRARTTSVIYLTEIQWSQLIAAVWLDDFRGKHPSAESPPGYTYPEKHYNLRAILQYDPYWGVLYARKIMAKDSSGCYRVFEYFKDQRVFQISPEPSPLSGYTKKIIEDMAKPGQKVGLALPSGYTTS
ncbi:MAG: hypothetical protein MJE77_25695 [Proteobacteria bacterium]|nr:hypothetical protein [Pseudomonadota bacterium]